MRVILTEKVPSLGNVGEVVNVSSGHARNFLIPQNLAVFADKKNTKVVEDQKRRLQKKIEGEKGQAVETKSKLDGLTLEFTKKVGGTGRIFGSVSANDISKALAEKGLEVEKRLFVITNPIKTLGDFKVTAKLFADVTAEFTVKVTMDQNQVEEIKKKQALAEKRAAAKKAKADEAPEEGTEEGTSEEAATEETATEE